jgi:hypothetical protein
MLFCSSYVLVSDYLWLCGLTICFISVSLSCMCLPYGFVVFVLLDVAVLNVLARMGVCFVVVGHHGHLLLFVYCAI